MTDAELEGLAVEGEPDVAESEPEAAADVERAGFVRIVGNAVEGLGNLACSRYGVPELRKAEVEAISGPAVDLLALYGIGPDDPKGQAWLALVMALTGTIGVRVYIHRKAMKAPPAPPAEGKKPRVRVRAGTAPVKSEGVPTGKDYDPAGEDGLARARAEQADHDETPAPSEA